ncbi:MAG TPA: acyloxyacyl hydrolase [Steroidobacteraceae bacterium]|nr:acyloxyacyl hydrolase [Steroidobacteraceae bacterium]
MREVSAWRLTMAAHLIGVLFLGAIPRLSAAEGLPGCQSCELRLGVGGTYHFWGRTGGAVIPATLTWDGDRYEVGVFRMAGRQTLGAASAMHTSRLLAEPYWGFSASRRWKLAGTSRWRLLFGFGGSYKTEADALNSTHWNFASQLAMQVRAPGSRSTLEVSVRHWSNGGLRVPNRGQDFVTLSYAF